MSNIRRYYDSGNIYFVTMVTKNRKYILIDNIDILKESIKRSKIKYDYSILASVVMPDHLHLIIDPNNNDLSKIIYSVKMSFSKLYHYEHKSSGKLWQLRFWDHIIRNQNDMNKHIDYIHYNPIKHGLVQSPYEWEFSSIHKYFKDGYYLSDWGKKDLKFEGDFGE